MKRYLLGLAAILLVIAALGCSFEDIIGQLGNTEGKPPVVTEVPRPTELREPTEPPPTPTATSVHVPVPSECDSPATPIQANTTLNLNMHSTSQSYPANCLYYCFAIADAGRLDIGIYNFSVDLDLYVGYGSIEAVDGVVPEWGESYDWMSNDFGTGDEEVTIPNPEAGTYYIEVCSYEGEASPFRLVTSVD
jgi:hypothetical protein